jgi:predicted DNA-binding protein
VKRLSLDLPEETHRRFKAACAAVGRKMAAELTDLIERRLEELEEKARR